MDFPNVVKTSIATPRKKTAHNLSCQHLTTLDFSMLRPVYYRNLLPGDKISINASCFSRLAPLQYPVLGDVKIETRAFWIPFRVISPQWQDFISNKLQTFYQDASSTPFVPKTTNWDICKLFLYGAAVDETGPITSNAFINVRTSSDDSTISCSIADETAVYFRFTTLGKNVRSIFQALGYEINWDYRDTTEMNMLPLLAFIRIFMDWYVNPNYDWSDIDYFFKCGLETFDRKNLFKLFWFAQGVNYRPDYFTAAQTSQLANGTIINNSYSVPAGSDFDEPSGQTVVSQGDFVQSVHSGLGASPTNWAIDLMSKLADFMKRNSIAGSRYVDQMLARFGARPSDSVAQRSSYLGSLITSVQMSDVTQTAPNTSSSNNAQQGVGAYTGKGIAYENGHWKFEADEHGIVVVVACVRPRCQYYQGRDRHLMHLDPLDFFTPEFDCVNMQAIRRDEWKADYDGEDFEIYYKNALNGYRPNGVFGFTPRYAEYKIAKDWLTGDFRDKDKQNTMRSFHVFREILGADGLTSAGSSVGIMDGKDRVNYDRIFQTPGTDYEHFICNFVYDVKLISSVRSISESLLPEEGHNDIDMRPYGMYF